MTIDSSSTRSEARILREINATVITGGELLEFFLACHERQSGDLDFATLMTTATRFAGHNPIRACALAFRARALAKIMDGVADGWVIRGSDGWVFAGHVVLAAAASQPLIAGYKDGVFRFNRSRFIARVLESAPPIQQPQSGSVT